MEKGNKKDKKAKAKAPKKEKTPLDNLIKSFLDDYNDNELQNRYDGMIENEKRHRKCYNELVPTINDLINRETILKMMIVESAKMGFLNAEVVTQLIRVERTLDENREKADAYKKDFEYEADLIKSYRSSSDNKLFVYWKAIKSLDPATPHWLEWKKPYENRIF